MTGQLLSGSLNRHQVACALLAMAAAACGPAEGVQIQELPPTERPTMEARAGLHEIEGSWNRAGWVVASPGTEPLLPSPAPVTIAVQAQRLDSLSGNVVGAEASRGFVGELRRDGVFSLLLPLAESSGAVLAGVVERDTLWLELSTLPGLEIPVGARAAYVRAPVGQEWVRLPSGALLRDTAVAPVTPPDVAGPAGQPASPAPGAGATTAPARPPAAAAPAATPPATPAPATPAPATTPVRDPEPDTTADPRPPDAVPNADTVVSPGAGVPPVTDPILDSDR